MLVALAGCAADPDAPRIDAIDPVEGPVGTRVTITGENFCGERPACDPLPVAYVSFGLDPQVDGAAVSWTDARIEAIVPGGAVGEVTVFVTVDGRSSNGVSFTVR